MKLQQLRYILEVFRRNLNVSEAAEALFTSQPGVSKQIRLLEEELGIQIFIRSGKRIVAVTPPGLAVLEKAEQILRDVQDIKNISGEFTDTRSGALTVAACATQMRFRLPEAVAYLTQAYPDVRVVLRPCSPAAAAEMVLNGEADLAVAAETPDVAGLNKLPCGELRYALLLPQDHRLLGQPEIGLHDLAACPLLTYPHTFQAGSSAARAFNRARIGISRTVLAAADDAVLATYVRAGLGIALVDAAACADTAADLAAADVSRLFEPATVHVLVRSNTLLRGYVYDFISRLRPDLSRSEIDRLLFAPAVEDFSI